MTLRSASLSRSKAVAYGAAAILPVAAAALLANLATIPNLGWYARLVKPTFTPPNWLFGPAWTVLYLLMAYGFYRVLRQPDYVPDRRHAIQWFLAQMLLNAGWSWAFFGAHSPVFGLGVVVLLFIAIALTLARFFAVDRRAGWSLVPYLVWVGFAGLLNLSILIRNS